MKMPKYLSISALVFVPLFTPGAAMAHHETVTHHVNVAGVVALAGMVLLLCLSIRSRTQKPVKVRRPNGRPHA